MSLEVINVVASQNNITAVVQDYSSRVVITDSIVRGPEGPPGPGANDAYAQANAAYAQANAAYAAANTGGNADVYNQANTARNTANAAYAAANSATGNYSNSNVAAYLLSNGVNTKANISFIRDQGFGDTPYFGFTNPDNETLKIRTNISSAELNTDLLVFDRQSQNATFTGNILPSSNNTQSLGSVQKQWKDLYVSNNTIYISNTPLSIDSNGNLTVNNSTIVGPQGSQGAVGAQGSQGQQGVQGEVGAQGSQGAVGAQGSQGQQGVQGAVGPAGNSVFVTANSAGSITSNTINFLNTATVTVATSNNNGIVNVEFTSVGGGATIAAPNNAILVANALSGANGTNNFVFNVATNFLGVGTNTPNSNITVTGNVWITTGINAATINITTANVQNVNGRSSLALGTSVGSNGNVIIHANGVEIIRATNARFVGINTTTPNSNLTVVGNVWVTTGFNVATINATTANVTTALVGTANVITGNISGSLFVGSSITTGGSNGDISNVNTVYASVVSANDLFIKQVFETTNALANATGTLEHDCALGHIFVHSTPSANFTVNFANVTITTNNATAFTLVINQGGTAYVPTAVQVNSQAQTVNWQGGTQPAGNPNKKDVVTFSIVNNNGTFITLGQLTSYG